MAHRKAASRTLTIMATASALAMTSLAGAATPVVAQEAAARSESPRGFTASEQFDGLFGVQIDRQQARVRIRLPKADEDGLLGRYLYQPGVAAGLGVSNVGLDRSGLGQTQIVAFHRVGRRVIASFENHRYRATGAGRDERDAVRASFATSNVWSGDIADEAADGSVVVDITGFLERDALNAVARLKRARQGTFRPVTNLGYVDVAATGVFPDNVEFQAVQTFASDEPGAQVSRITPEPRNLTLTVNHSFIRLPDEGFTPRPHDPRTGTSAQVLVTDFATGLDEAVVSRLSRRFRLEKTDPTAERSSVKQPIVFYVDRGAPEPIRNALIAGGDWWREAFDQAGFIDAFRVELLPEGVSPLDARYNIIAWVHRESRGWSTGSTVLDPRTGEIVRGVVQLGSLRDRQDQMIFEGLTSVADSEQTARLVYQRLRHLSAHEIGHALGIAHNFAASTFADRASVMDYPAPWVIADGDRLDFSQAYTEGVGAWDRHVIRWLYDQAPTGADQAQRLASYVEDGQAKGYRFVSDGDTRDVGGAQPYGVMWDNGEDAVAELGNVMAVRAIALNRFGLHNLPDGAAVADLQRVIAPIYLYHRYQTVGTARLIAGVDYRYAVKGDGDERSEVIPAERQRAALEAVMQTLTPQALDLPDRVLDLLSSAQSGVGDKQVEIELFDSRLGGVFDPLNAASVAADVSLEALLAPARLNRLVEQQRRDSSQLSLTELLDRVTAAGGVGGRLSAREMELRRVLRARIASRLAASLIDNQLSPTAQATVRASLVRYGEQLRGCARASDRLEAAQCVYLGELLTGPVDGLADLAKAVEPAPNVPPGAPI